MTDTNGLESNHYSNNDEIDLFDLVDDIWSHKLWVFVGLFATILLAGVYLFKAVPVYQTESVIKSATDKDLTEFLRPQLASIYTLSVDQAFTAAQSALMSTEYRRDFYQLKLDDIKAVEGAYNEKITLDQNFTNFSKTFSVSASGSKDSQSFVKVSLESSDAEFASKLLNDFVEYALTRRLNDSYETMQAKVNGRLESLNYQADIIREEYMSSKVRRILELKEATEIATAVGQDNPVYRNMDLVGGQLPPLYMLGSKAINAEVQALETRDTMAKDLPRGEDHFIKGLPKILLEIDSLKTLKIDLDKIKLARVDEVALVPVGPIKPRKLLILALAIVAGLFVGLFMALIVAAYKKHKTRIEEKRRLKKSA